MKPLQDMPRADVLALHTLVSDIDDTITSEGKLTAQAYTALERLQQSGLRTIVTTGRPAGWCDHIARMWPVDAVVGENGALYYWYDAPKRKLNVRHGLPEAERLAHAARMAAVRARILAEVPGCAVASDQFARLYDLAIDFAEDVGPLPDTDVARIVALMEEAGMTAKVSSIHVNGWYGDYDKLSMTRTLMRERFGIDLDAERARFAYAGDSPNDAPMFGFLPNSVGVANVRGFVGKLAALPGYVTQGHSGAGFAELADFLIAARRDAGLF